MSLSFRLWADFQLDALINLNAVISSIHNIQLLIHIFFPLPLTVSIKSPENSVKIGRYINQHGRNLQTRTNTEDNSENSFIIFLWYINRNGEWMFWRFQFPLMLIQQWQIPTDQIHWDEPSSSILKLENYWFWCAWCKKGKPMGFPWIAQLNKDSAIRAQNCVLKHFLSQRVHCTEYIVRCRV